MRIIMFGTGPFAVPTFQSLLESSHEVLALVTRPIQDAGKRRKTSQNPTRDLGESESITIYDPPSCNDDDFVAKLVDLKADLFVVCDYGQILSRACLGAAKLGGINLHGSLLPKYRGAAPINWAIYNGEPELGITIIHMTAKLDGGPCLATASVKMNQETAEEIEPVLANLGVQPVHDAIKMLETWDGESLIGEKQDPKLATKAPRLQKSDGLIDWTKSATQIVNQIRAFQPWPGSFTNWDAEHLKQPMRMIIHRAAVEPATIADSSDDASNATKVEPATGLTPGQVALCDKGNLIVQTGDGFLSITQIQPAGKKSMPIADFLRGNPPKVGDQLA